jgi:hypothetical protein
VGRRRVRINLTLDPDTIRILKSRADKEGRAVSRIVEDLVVVRTKLLEKKVDLPEVNSCADTLDWLEDIETRLDKISKSSEVEDIK